jgi:hypothetical protein
VISRVCWLSEVTEYIPHQVREDERSAIPRNAPRSSRRSAAVGWPEVLRSEGAGDRTDERAAFSSICTGPAMTAAVPQS